MVATPTIVTHMHPTSPRGLAPRYLTRAQAAAHADISITTVDRWRKAGLLTTHYARGGRLVLIDRSELDDVLSPVPAALGA